MSREQIVQTTIELLEAEPFERLTISRVAKAVGVAPMTLYSYFADRDALVAAVAKAVRAASEPIDYDDDWPWEQKISVWMYNVRDHVCRYPQLVEFTAGGGSQSWMVVGAELLAILEPLGDWGDSELARAHYWVAASTMGHAMIEASRPNEAPTSEIYAALSELPPDAAARMVRVIAGLGELHDSTFELVVERTIAGLEGMLPVPGDG